MSTVPTSLLRYSTKWRPRRPCRATWRLRRPGWISGRSTRAICATAFEVFEPDNGGLMIDAPDKEVTRRISAFRGDVVRTGWIGRQLPRLFKSAGLLNVAVEVLPSPRTDY